MSSEQHRAEGGADDDDELDPGPVDPARGAPTGSARDARTGRTGAANRIQHQASWVDQQIRVAMAKGDFDDLPGAGKPLKLGATHDPDWWLKQLVEREQITVLPMSTQLRREDAELDARLDTIATEGAVRAVITDFNTRVVAARYRAPEGPPLVTMPRDVDADVAAWHERRTARLARQQATARAAGRPDPDRPHRWWRRRR